MCPFEFGLATGVNEINSKRVYIVSSCYDPLLHSSPYKIHSPFLPRLKACQFKWEHASSRLLSSFYSSKHQPDTPLHNRVHAFYSYLYFDFFSFMSLRKYACIFSSVMPTLYKGHKPSCLASSHSSIKKYNSDLSCILFSQNP